MENDNTSWHENLILNTEAGPSNQKIEFPGKKRKLKTADFIQVPEKTEKGKILLKGKLYGRENVDLKTYSFKQNRNSFANVSNLVNLFPIDLFFKILRHGYIELFAKMTKLYVLQKWEDIEVVSEDIL